MSRYLVELLSDLNEEVSVYVEADNEAEAEAISNDNANLNHDSRTLL